MFSCYFCTRAALRLEELPGRLAVLKASTKLAKNKQEPPMGIFGSKDSKPRIESDTMGEVEVPGDK